MARLPDFTALGQSPVPQASGSVASYSPVDYGKGGAGAGMQDAANDLHEASAILQQTNDRQDQMVAIAAANSLHERAIDLHLGKGGFNEVKGAGTLGEPFLKTYQQKFDDQKTAIEGALLNDNQRRMFQQHAGPVSAQYKSQLLTHQANETNHFNDTTADSTINLARRDMAANPMDSNAMAAGMAKIDWAIDRKAERNGWSPEVKAFTREKYIENLYQDIGQVLVERDPAGALAALNKKLGVGVEAGPTGIAAIDRMPADKAVPLRHRALSVVTQDQNKAEAEAKRRLHEAEVSFKGLREFTLTGQMVSPEYELEIAAKTAGTPYEGLSKQLVGASYAAAAFGSKTLGAQRAELLALDARLQAGSDPESAKLVAHARTIHSAQEQAYKDNPWAAGTRFARLPAVPEQPIASADQVPKLIAQRLPLMSGVETYADRPINPLQPAETQAFAEKLRALPPDAKSEVLAQTGALLSAPRLEVLADALDKHDKPMALALKMGLDRTTAGRAASVLVLRGAQALHDKTIKKDDSAIAGWRGEIAPLVRGTMGDEKAENDIIDAAYYVRAGLEQGDAPPGGLKKADSDSETALSFVIGLPLERSGVKTFMPKGQSKSDFDKKIGAYTVDKLKEQAPSGVLYLRGQPVQLQNVANRITQYGLKRDGQGRYIPTLNNAPFTIDPQGNQMLRLEAR